MGFEYFLQQLVNGICLGGMYALMSVGYSLVYSIMNFSNFAHGGVIMVGAYVGYFALTSLNVSFFPAFLLCGLGSGLLAVIIERLVYSPLRKRHAPSLYFIISAMGASIFLENFVIATIDGTPRNYPPIFDNRISIGGISLGVDSLLMIVVSSVALLILMFIIQKTKVGLAIRACAYSEKASTLMGINGDLVIFIIFLMAVYLRALPVCSTACASSSSPPSVRSRTSPLSRRCSAVSAVSPVQSSARCCLASWRSSSRPSTPTCAICSCTRC